MATAQPADVEQQARRRLVAEKGFYVHLVTYVAVISGLLLIKAMTGSSAGGSSGPRSAGASALATFGLFGLGRDWDYRRLKELITKSSSEASRRGAIQGEQ